MAGRSTLSTPGTVGFWSHSCGVMWADPERADRERQARLDRLWRSGFGRLAMALNQAELELLEHPDDPLLQLRRDNLAAALRGYPRREA